MPVTLCPTPGSVAAAAKLSLGGVTCGRAATWMLPVESKESTCTRYSTPGVAGKATQDHSKPGAQSSLRPLGIRVRVASVDPVYTATAVSTALPSVRICVIEHIQVVPTQAPGRTAMGCESGPPCRQAPCEGRESP